MTETKAAMQVPGIPANEMMRLMVLHRLRILDTAPEESFDRVTRLAARALNVPIVLVSLVDESRQWFKSCVGLDVTQTPREISFCGHAILQDQPLVVPDAMQDARFAGNPLVTDAPHVRAYLGIPLRTGAGLALGTLCAIDHAPRPFSPQDIETLTDFARIVQDIINARQQTVQVSELSQLATEREELLSQTFEQVSVAIFHTALDGRIVRANRRACEMFGYEMDELLSLSYTDITHPDDIGASTRSFQRMATVGPRACELEKRYLRKDGETIWAHVLVSMRSDADGAPDHSVSVAEDISARKFAELELEQARERLQAQATVQQRQLQDSREALRRQSRETFESTLAVCRAENRLRAIANNVPALIGYWDSELRCEFANRAFYDWFGLDPQQMIGKSMDALLGSELFKTLEARIHLALGGQPQRFERALVRVDGTGIITDNRYLPDISAQGEVRGFYVMATDVTALREAQQSLERANARLSADSMTDYLTGLANRRMFSQKAEEAYLRFRHAGQPYGLVLLDLDDFKRINDRFGHAVGDEVLRSVGAVLREQLRGSNDLAGRLGGEEFALLCVGTADSQALDKLAERIRLWLSNSSVQSAYGSIFCTASFGVAGCRASDGGWKDIYARADAALYQAKAQGKDRIVHGPRTTDPESTGIVSYVRSIL